MEKSPNRLQQVLTFLSRFGFDAFLLLLLSLIILAYFWPDLGKEHGILPLEPIGTYGVSLIFFFYGLRLSPEKLKAGLSSWRLHLLVQLTTFLLFPLLILGLHHFFAHDSTHLIWLGTFYLAALPSTVSSSVVMVSIAGGNLPAAIFNASISSLLGVFLTPLWMGLFLQNQVESFDIWSVLGKLVLQVVVPVIIGVILHRRWGSFAEQNKKRLKYFDQAIILIIVFTAFCDSFARNQFKDFSLFDIFLLSLAMTILFFAVYGLVYLISQLIGLNRENQITALFCGSKKSMVHGTVMSKVLFPDANMVGLILLPLMLYHALQLIYASIMAQAMARRANLSSLP